MCPKQWSVTCKLAQGDVQTFGQIVKHFHYYLFIIYESSSLLQDKYQLQSVVKTANSCCVVLFI